MINAGPHTPDDLHKLFFVVTLDFCSCLEPRWLWSNVTVFHNDWRIKTAQMMVFDRFWTIYQPFNWKVSHHNHHSSWQINTFHKGIPRYFKWALFTLWSVSDFCVNSGSNDSRYTRDISTNKGHACFQSIFVWPNVTQTIVKVNACTMHTHTKRTPFYSTLFVNKLLIDSYEYILLFHCFFFNVQ